MRPKPILEPSVPLAPPARRRERQLTLATLAIALVLGALCQHALPTTAWWKIGVTLAFAIVPTALAFAFWRSLRDSIASFRFAGAILAVLAVVVMAGTIIPPYNKMFHTHWFGALLGVFIAAVFVSMVRRLPPSWKTFGFFLAHVGLLLVLLGAAISSAFSVRGRIDLHTSGPPATTVSVTRGGERTGEEHPLGFSVKLDDFRVDSYEAEYRLALYKITPDGNGKQIAVFDRDVDVDHRLPDGASFRVLGPAGQLAVRVALTDAHGTREGILSAANRDAVFFGIDKALTFERRPDEVKAYRSSLTLVRDGVATRAPLAVNAPVELHGWTLYQVNFNPRDLGYSGLEAVYDPGIAWVFTGFAFLALGVPYMLNVVPLLRRRQQAGGRS